MKRRQGQGWTRGRAAFLALAFLALLVKVTVPAGFMLATPQSGSGFPLVLCTGHGPLESKTADQKGGETKAHSDAPCAFAGHAAPPKPALGAEVPQTSAIAYTRQTATPADLIPGRGLAAPPPPSQGPPLSL